ncbi:SMR family transporter [Streptosporangium sp. NPDC003464]
MALGRIPDSAVVLSVSTPARCLSALFRPHSMETLPVGTAYAVFTGIGATGAIILGRAVIGVALTTAADTAKVQWMAW